METKQVHINDLKSGDTVVHAGVVKTLTSCNIGGDKFIGRTIWGDSYHAGNKPVELVVSW